MNDEKAVVAAALLDPSNRAATAAADVGAIIRAARTALGLSQTALAGRIGYVSQATVSRLERSKTRAVQDASVLADLAVALHLPASALGLARRTRAAEGASRVDDVRRRDFLRGAAALTATALLPQAISSATVIDRPDVEHAWRSLSRLFELDDLHGGVQVYEVAGAMARKLGDALRMARFDTAIRGELHAVAATTMEHAGWLSFDAGQGAIARSWWLETIHLARDVGDAPTAHVAALASMSLHASVTATHMRESASLAEAARRAAGSAANPTLLSVVAAREAVGHAHLGDRAAAHAALTESHRQLEHGPRSDDPLWLQFWSAADLACHQARMAVALGDANLAERSARSALDLADETRFPRNHAIYSARLGSVLTRRRQFDEAIGVTRDAVKRIDQLSGSRRIVDDLAATVDLLAIQEYGPARQFAGAARQLMASA